MDLLTHMRIFVDIAHQGSMAGAARAQGLAPSTVTASLKRLEDRVHTQLVLRSTRRLTLTREGQIFLAHCEQILDLVGEAVNQLAPDGPLTGTIKITSIADFGRTRLSPLLDAFQELHPGVRIELHLSDTLADLIAGGFDIALRTGPLADSGLVARLLMRGGRSIVAAPSYWDRFGRPKRPEDLLHHNCLILSRGNASQPWRFHRDERSFSVAVSGNRIANDGGLLRRWALAGTGVIMKTDFDIAGDVAEGKLEAVLDDYKERDINLYAVHVAGEHPPRRVEAFLNYLSEVL